MSYFYTKEIIAERLKNQRKLLNLSQRSLSKIIYGNVNNARVIARIEDKDSDFMPSLSVLINITEALNMSLSQLFKDL